jgi:hypothetical protein
MVDAVLTTTKLAEQAEADSIGNTTLLIAILYEPPDAKQSYWCYAYIGTGYLTLLNPDRSFNQRLIPTQLLTQQHAMGRTARMPRDGEWVNLAPVVGLVAYHTGDILIAASDGFKQVKTYLENTGLKSGNGSRRISPEQYFWEKVFKPLSMDEMFTIPNILEDSEIAVQPSTTIRTSLMDDTTIEAIHTRGL